MICLAAVLSTISLVDVSLTRAVPDPIAGADAIPCPDSIDAAPQLVEGSHFSIILK
jgi:hypothetical protein